MALYRVLLMPSVTKDFRNIPKSDRQRIDKRISALSENPHPGDSIKLVDQDCYRIRQGNYRIMYEIHDDLKTVLVLKVGHRKEIYRVSEEKEKFAAEKTKTRTTK